MAITDPPVAHPTLYLWAQHMRWLLDQGFKLPWFERCVALRAIWHAGIDTPENTPDAKLRSMLSQVALGNLGNYVPQPYLWPGWPKSPQ